MDFDPNERAKESLVNLNPEGQETVLWKSRGHIQKVGPMAISYGLAKVQDASSKLLRIKYAGESAWEYDVEIALYSVVVCIATQRKWTDFKHGHPLRGKELLRHMTILALWEHIHHHVCPICKGRANALIEDKLVVCPQCNGAGRSEPTDESRTKYLISATGVHAFDFAPWMEKYRRIQDVLRAWERDAWKCFATAYRHECDSPVCAICNSE